MDKSNKDFDTHNREELLKFIRESEKFDDELSGFVFATIVQFIMNLRVRISKIAKTRKWVTTEEIIDSQVAELMACIVDLETYKQRLIKGVTQQ